MEICKRVLNFRKKQKCTVSLYSQRGMTIVEYAVAGALVAAALLVAFGALGNQVGFVLNNIVIGIG